MLETLYYTDTKKPLRRDRSTKYLTCVKNDYNKFKNDNKKTVMYLVKEFEMKKSATATKSTTTDKHIIDPLKLSSYKYNDDIFKKLTILPDAKKPRYDYVVRFIRLMLM